MLTSAFLVIVLLPTAALVVSAACLTLPPELLERQPEQSIRFEDRQGRLLREVRGRMGALSQWTALEQIPPLLVDAVIAVEDRRFYMHPGVDPVAVLRAAWQDIYYRRIISGASTLSMQLARRVRPHRRDLSGKFLEMALALRIEATLSKSQILEQYLNRVDFGPNLRGVAAAALGYFDKPLTALSDGELVLLAGLPQSPSALALSLHPERATARRARVIERLVDQGRLSATQAKAIRIEPIAHRKRGSAFGAPHFIAALNSGELSKVQPSLAPDVMRTARRVRTTLDSDLQQRAEVALSTVLEGLRPHRVTAGAVLVVDNATGDVLAYVGSPNFYAEAHQGQVDGVRALRQPGSTLKPFVYAAAFEQLNYTAATVLADLPLRLQTEAGEYLPRNFDDQFRGPVRLREALGNSLNVPAVQTASALGAASLLQYLHRLGFDSLRETPEYYGPALALGDGEVTLLELVRAYVALARGGTLIPLRVISEVTQVIADRSGSPRVDELRFESGQSERVLPISSSAVLTDILKDPSARVASFGPHSPLEFGFDVAAKTGTSKGFRDNWTVGYTSALTIGVWVGNFDGSPMLRVSGITGAAPVFHAVLEGASQSDRRAQSLPLSRWTEADDLGRAYQLQMVRICPLSGELSGPQCPHAVNEFIPINLELPTCGWHRDLPLDKRNGLLAGPSCPANAIAHRTFEILPERFAEWARSSNRSQAPERYSPNCPEPTTALDASGALRITYPTSGSRFVIDPERPRALQLLRIEVAAPPSLEELSLWVDDRVSQKSHHPFAFQWQLSPGHHRFIVVAKHGEKSEPVEIDVR